MQIAFFRRAAARLIPLLRSNTAFVLGCGALAGSMLFSVHHQYAANLGTALSVTVAAALALACGVEAARHVARRLAIVPGRRLAALVLFGLAAWVVAMPLLCAAVVGVIGFLPAELLGTESFGFPVALVAAALLLAPPATLAGLLACVMPCGPQSRPSSSTRFLGSLALSVAACGLVLAPAVGVQACGLLAALASACLLVAVALRPQESTGAEVHATQNPAGTADRLAPLFAMPVVACLGAAVAISGRIVHQLMAATAPLVVADWSVILGGAAMGFALGRRRSQTASPRGSVTIACLVAAAALVFGTACFPLLLRTCLALNANVSQVWLLMGLRVSIAAICFLPLGACWGFVAARCHQSSDAPRLHPLAFVAGWACVRLVALPLLTVPVLVLMVAMALLALAACVGLSTQPNRRRVAFQLAASCCVAAGLVGVFTGYDAAGEARLLFSTRVFMAHRSGYGHNLLPALDDARLMARIEGEHGTFTLWKYHGLQMHVRESGIPRGLATLDARVFPEYSAELAPAVLPLVLHEQPHRVLVLGLGGGVPVTTCLAFPVQHLVCVEGDRALVAGVRDVVWKRAGIDPLRDDRMKLLEVDPVLAMNGGFGEQDVIIANSDHPSLWKSAPAYTLEFYKRVARHLTSDGIFCQRFQQVDLGPGPIRDLSKTLRTVFADTAAIEVAPGEFLFVCAKDAGGLQRDGLASRLQAHHVRRALAQIGWDWSVVLNLAAYDHAALGKLIEAGDCELNTAANGAFAFQLPGEVMRWGMKSREVFDALSPHTGSMLRWSVVDGNDPDILHRLSEVVGQRNLMTRYADQPWAYRKTLKEQLSEHPRSALEQVSGTLERVLHPEDRRRKKYFETLGQATGKASPPLTSVVKLNDFTDPYDPLLTFFAHHEMAALHARAAEKDHNAELRHRLHTIFYADQSDRSVRNVAAAMDLVVAHPEITTGAQSRFDLLNGLLQSIKMRWDTRASDKPKNVRIAINDTDISLTSIEHTIDELDELAPEAGIADADWNARKVVLEKTLVRPLRTFRSNLLPHHAKQQRQTAEILEKASAETP